MNTQYPFGNELKLSFPNAFSSSPLQIQKCAIALGTFMQKRISSNNTISEELLQKTMEAKKQIDFSLEEKKAALILLVKTWKYGTSLAFILGLDEESVCLARHALKLKEPTKINHNSSFLTKLLKSLSLNRENF